MYRAVVIGTSSGGFNALKTILPALPVNFPLPVIVVQHLAAHTDSYWVNLLNSLCNLQVKEADEKEPLQPGVVYTAPPNYHLLVQSDETLALTVDEKVNFARPSIDVLFETAAGVYQNALIGVVLTGANNDGAKGLKAIKDRGGLTIVQDPLLAESSYMPAAAITAASPHYVLPLTQIADLLIKKAEL